MKVFRRTCALALMVMMLLGFTATAFALPKGFKLSDSMPKTVECAVLTKTADFKAADRPAAPISCGGALPLP